MTYTLEILSAADDETAQTMSWLLEHASPEHATRYANAITKALDEILERPLTWPQWKSRPDIRVRHLREIPYSIFYRLRNRIVVVIAFAHTSRLPGYWLARIL